MAMQVKAELSSKLAIKVVCVIRIFLMATLAVIVTGWQSLGWAETFELAKTERDLIISRYNCVTRARLEENGERALGKKVVPHVETCRIQYAFSNKIFDWKFAHPPDPEVCQNYDLILEDSTKPKPQSPLDDPRTLYKKFIDFVKCEEFSLDEKSKAAQLQRNPGGAKPDEPARPRPAVPRGEMGPTKEAKGTSTIRPVPASSKVPTAEENSVTNSSDEGD